jgi:hypothetical protein
MIRLHPGSQLRRRTLAGITQQVEFEISLENFYIMCDGVKNRGRLMKPKKAVTLLTRIETLLSDALDEYSVIEKHVEKNVRAVLLSAQASVASAIDFISALPSSGVRQKAAKSRKGRRRPLKAKSKAKSSVRAKKRPAAAAKKRS